MGKDLESALSGIALAFGLGNHEVSFRVLRLIQPKVERATSETEG